MPHPFLTDPWPAAIAHRGGDHVGAENTLAAFGDAVGLGYRYLETDLHVTRDGVLVLHHDPTLDRVTDGTGPVEARTWAELAEVRVDGREPVPRLDELVTAFPDVRLVLDVKSDAGVETLVQRLRHDHDLLERTCVGSFSDARLRRIRQALGERVCTSAGPNEVRRIKAAAVLGRTARWVRPGAVLLQVPPRVGALPVVDDRFLATADALGLGVHVWTINDDAEMERWLDTGVVGIVTDRTRALREVFRRRGSWPAT